ncbi:MAG: diguanylate cyclase [Gammaproteobacteria bacterium]
MSENTADKPRLLIVDDSKVIRVTARKILRDHFETTEAVDGENAWEILSGEETFSMVVTDLTMPRLDGFGLLERIRNSTQPQISNLPVIVITGANDSDTIKERARQAGATDFIGKPFDSVHLLARTQAHASSHSAASTLKKEKVTLEEKSLIDPLTGLANETAFMERSYQQLSYAIRHGTSLSMFRLEIDDYGDLFAQYGDNVSELVIKAVTMVLQAAIRQEDTAARIGTARFALLLPGMNNTGIRALAERINRDISSRIIRHEGARIRVTVSIGIASPDIRRNTRFEELLSIGDQRLAHAISQGGNQVVFKDPEIISTPGKKAIFTSDTSIFEEEDANPVGVKPARKPFDIDELLKNGAEIEEVEAFTPEPTIGYFDPPGTAGPGSKESEKPLPTLFAGPVPDSATRIDVAEARPDVSRSSSTTRIPGTAAESRGMARTSPARSNPPAGSPGTGKPVPGKPVPGNPVTAAPAATKPVAAKPPPGATDSTVRPRATRIESIEVIPDEGSGLMRLIFTLFTPWNWFR